MNEAEAAVTRLAEFAASAELDQVPAAVQERALSAIVDTIGVMIGGARTPPAVRSRAALAMLEAPAPGSSVVIGMGPTGSRSSSAWCNAISGHALDFDDTHWPTILHCSNPLISALLAASAGSARRGRAFLTAYVVGFEVGSRLALAMPEGHYDRGWHITATVGGIAAAVGCTRLLGGGIDEMRQAISLAANQASGHRQHFGSMAKSLNAGNAARVGLVSATLSLVGFEADPAGLEGSRGMWRVMSNGPDLHAASDGLGTTWEILRNGLKPYPCGVVSHPAIAATEEAVAGRAIEADSIRSIEIDVHPLVVELTGKDALAAEYDVKFSIRTLVALSCLGHSRNVDAYTTSFVRQNPSVADVAQQVTVRVNPTLGSAEALVRIEIADHPGLSHKVTAPPGSPARPLSPAEVRAKFTSLCASVDVAQPHAFELLDALAAFSEDSELEAVQKLLGDIRLADRHV